MRGWEARDFSRVRLHAKLTEKGMPYGLRDIFPRVLVAGGAAGVLTAEGARKYLQVSQV